MNMATPRRNPDNFLKVGDSDVEHLDIIQKSMEKLMAADDTAERRLLRSRIDEQSGLICMLKQRADELLLRCQAMQKINVELEDQANHCQRELDGERKKAEVLQQRFTMLAANNQGIIGFMEEHKKNNAELKLKNEQLQSENDSLFSQKLQDKEVFVQKVLQDIKLLTEEYTHKENQYREKLNECETKLLEQATQHKAKEASLLDQLHEAQQQHTEALQMCKDLKLRLQETKEQHAAKEISMRESLTKLSKERDKLLSLSMERGRVIQEKQEEIQQLETNWKEEKKARVEAEDRFKVEAEAVNKDAKVTSLRAALEESVKKIENLNKDFDAFKEHSINLLTQERELNKKLRHMIG